MRPSLKLVGEFTVQLEDYCSVRWQ